VQRNPNVQIRYTCRKEKVRDMPTAEHDIRETIRRIREAAQHAGISQTALAKRAGISRMTVHRLLKGEQALTMEHVWVLAAALDTSPAELLPLDVPTDPRWSKLTAAVTSRAPGKVVEALAELGVHLDLAATPTLPVPQLLAAADAVSQAGEQLRAAVLAMSESSAPS